MSGDRVADGYTCHGCGRYGHDTPACPAPNERDVVGYLPSNNLPVYMGDLVTTETAYNPTGPVTRTYVTRTCRADDRGRPACTLHAGHNVQVNHRDYDGTNWRVERD